jgi:hypothetical protein
MKKIVLLLTLLSFLSTIFCVQAQEKTLGEPLTTKKKRLKKSELEKIPEPNTFIAQTHFDNAFGFRPEINGSIGYDNTKSITFYGVVWNSETPVATQRPQLLRGSEPWVEAGVGASIKFFEKTLTLKPQVGIVNGSFLNGEKSLALEGITPSLSIFYKKNNINFEMRGAGYFTLRSSATASKDLLMIHASPSLQITKNIAIGGHIENFSNIHPSVNTQILLVGGFMKINIGEKYQARFLTGLNLKNQSLYASEIFRLSVAAQLF